jgi:hypothetical protein
MRNVSYAESHIQALYAECHYAECHYNKCRGAILLKINIFQYKVMIQYLSNKVILVHNKSLIKSQTYKYILSQL